MWTAFWQGLVKGFRDSFARSVKESRLRRCRHPNVSMTAATGATPCGPVNVEVGVVAICADCGYSWKGDVRAGMSQLADLPITARGATEVQEQARRYARGDTRPS